MDVQWAGSVGEQITDLNERTTMSGRQLSITKTITIKLN
ncbi:MAG: hypothetical protein ACI8RD_008138 [Bacillariaceae sp.]|jgi:hypothetical protein